MNKETEILNNSKGKKFEYFSCYLKRQIYIITEYYLRQERRQT